MPLLCGPLTSTDPSTSVPVQDDRNDPAEPASFTISRPAPQRDRAGTASTCAPKTIPIDHHGVINLGSLVLPPHITAKDLVDFEKCPRRYFYNRIFGLRGATRDNPFLKTHHCLYAVIDYIKMAPPGAVFGEHVLLQKLDEAWQSHSPLEHAFEKEYKALAENIVHNLALLQQGLSGREREDLAINLGTGRIVVIPNQVASLPDGTVLVRFVKTGRKKSSAPDDTIYGAYHESARQAYGGGHFKLELVHLTDGAVTDLPMSSQKVQSRLRKLGRYLDDITKGRFPTKPEDTACPRCPHFFICLAIPSVAPPSA